jgi:hypothetical protein
VKKIINMESKGSPAGVFPHKNKPASIHISQQSQESTTGAIVTTNLTAPLTPRIDISRASSSSYHEDSSPENVFDQVIDKFPVTFLVFNLHSEPDSKLKISC